MDWFHCMRCMAQPEDFESAAAMPAFFFTSCGHVLCGPCTKNNLALCARCGSSPIQMMAVSNDMPDDVAFLFRDVAADIKSIYKANMFQSAHMERLCEGVIKQSERRDRERKAQIDALTKELADLKVEYQRLKRVVEQQESDLQEARRGYGSASASGIMFHRSTRREEQPMGATSAAAAWANNHFSGLVTSHPVTRETGSQQGAQPVRNEPVTRFHNWNRF